MSLLAQTGAEAIGAGVAAANDDDTLAVGEDGERRIDGIAFAAFVLLRQKLHGEVDSLQLATGNGQVARLLRTTGEQDGIVLVGESFDGHVDADMRVRDKGDAFGAHLFETAIDECFSSLKLGMP